MVPAIHALASEILCDGITIFKGEFLENLAYGILPFLQWRLAAKENERVGSRVIITEPAGLHDDRHASAVLHEHHLRRTLGAKFLGEIPNHVSSSPARGEISNPAFLQAVG